MLNDYWNFKHGLDQAKDKLDTENRAADKWILKDLKRELSQFNASTGEWKS